MKLGDSTEENEASMASLAAPRERSLNFEGSVSQLGSVLQVIMSQSRDLYKTKLCTLYQRGNCHRQACSFAHGDMELRKTSGRHNYRGGDLRERLDRRSSPLRRRSPGGDGGGGHSDRKLSRDRGISYSRSPSRHRASRSFSSPRSPEHKRSGSNIDRGEVKKSCRRTDAQLSELSVDMPHGDSNVKDMPLQSDSLTEQLHMAEADLEALNEQKMQLEASLQSALQETQRLASKNAELESKVADAHADYKRLGSKIKKFVRAYMRYVRSQEDVKRAQAKLQRLTDELPADEEPRVATLGEVTDANITSEGEHDKENNRNNHGTDADLASTGLESNGPEMKKGRRKSVSGKNHSAPFVGDGYENVENGGLGNGFPEGKDTNLESKDARSSALHQQGISSEWK